MSFAADRRNLLKFLAASPLIAESALAEGLRWPDPMDWAPHDPGKLITDPTQALDAVKCITSVKHKSAAPYVASRRPRGASSSSVESRWSARRKSAP